MIQEFIQGLHDFHFLQNALDYSHCDGVVGPLLGFLSFCEACHFMGMPSHAALPGVALSYILGLISSVLLPYYSF